MLAVRDVLRAARRLVEDPGRWCTGATARTVDGMACDPVDARAVMWSAAGAVERLVPAGDAGTTLAHALLETAAQDAHGGRTLAWVEAILGHGAVLDVLDRAAAYAEALADRDRLGGG